MYQCEHGVVCPKLYCGTCRPRLRDVQLLAQQANVHDKPAPELTVENVLRARVEGLEAEVERTRKAAAQERQCKPLRVQVEMSPEILAAERRRIVGEVQSEIDAVRKAAADALAVVTRERDEAMAERERALAGWAACGRALQQSATEREKMRSIRDQAGALQDRLVREVGRKAFDAWAKSTKGLIAPLGKDGGS